MYPLNLNIINCTVLQAEVSVLVDVLYRPELLFPTGLFSTFYSLKCVI